MAADLSVVEVLVELLKAVVVEHVVEMTAEVVESVVVAHQFEMEMVPLMVGFSLEQLHLDQQQLCYPWLVFHRSTLIPIRLRQNFLHVMFRFNIQYREVVVSLGIILHSSGQYGPSWWNHPLQGCNQQ